MQIRSIYSGFLNNKISIMGYVPLLKLDFRVTSLNILKFDWKTWPKVYVHWDVTSRDDLFVGVQTIEQMRFIFLEDWKEPIYLCSTIFWPLE